MNPRKYQQLAQRLAAEGGDAELRTAASRAYYGLFNVAVESLNPIVPLSRGPAAHGQVQKILANCGDETLAGVGSDLGELHSRRIDADYDMVDPACENQRTVQAITIEADEMIRLLDRAFSRSGSETLKRTIQQYWTQTLRESLRDRKTF